MIDLSSEPSLGTLILSQDGTLKYSYVLPRGMTFPTGSEATIVFSDRAGGTYNIGDYKYGSMSDDLTTFTWVIGSTLTNQVNAGENFEVFVSVDGDTYKVRYGRVVRKQVSYPLNPITVASQPIMYEDDMQRNVPGPRWLAKHGAVSMSAGTGITGINVDTATGAVIFSGANVANGTKYTMASRYTADIFGTSLALAAKSSVQWYAPMQSDDIEISVRLIPGASSGNADGECFIVFASNSSMTSWLAVRITDPGGGATDTIQVVKGSSAAPPSFNWTGSVLTDYTPAVTVLGSTPATLSFDTPTWTSVTASSYTYKITYNGSSTNPIVSVYTPTTTGVSTTPALSTNSATISSAGVNKGAGYRYVGLMFNGSLVTTGPRVWYWKAKDAVS
jgi:hypothetical protein